MLHRQATDFVIT